MFALRCGIACVIFASINAAAQTCSLVLQEDRSERVLAVLPFGGLHPGAFVVAFEHSVLGTTVEDHYVWRVSKSGFAAWLTEERFSGEGYGLPHVALAGERLEKYGNQWRLMTNRLVDPLVVRPLPAQRMRLVMNGKVFPLAHFNPTNLEAAQRFTTKYC
jgi:hypothetical protein